MTRIPALVSALAVTVVTLTAGSAFVPPAAFSKSAPANGAVGVAPNPTLSWAASSGAASYEYCYDTTNDNACAAWVSTGTNVSASLSGLASSMTYYWQARATNPDGTTYANGSSTAFWSFTTQAGPDIRITPTSLAFVPQPSNTIYVELDWMEDGSHSHRPSQTVIDTIVQTFAREGFTLVIDVSNAIAHQTVVAVTNSPSSSAAVQALKATHFNHAGDSRYFYSLWVHNYSYNGGSTTSSGIADLPGSTHLVSLGSFSGGTGTASNQIGTFIHEFGHNIGQRHGGVDHANYKPNYLSVMNYYYQLNGLGPSLVALQFANTTSGFNTFGFSHGLLPSLNEASLDENLGIGLGRARDWNCDGVLSASVARDIQASNPCNGVSGQSVLTDHDNWSAIDAFVQTGAIAPRSTDEPSPLCVTPEDDLPIRTAIEQLRAQQLMPDERAFLASPLDVPPALASSGQYFDVHNDGNAALSVTGITVVSPSPWITWEPQTFSVAPGGVQRVHVYLDMATMPAGSTMRTLVVASNDPDENPSAVNLTMGSPLPNSFGKTAPASGTTGVASNPTLSWAASAGATMYRSCIDTTNDNACTVWNNNLMNLSVNLSGLLPSTTHYWHVRATNPGGTTYADDSATAFWNFTTAAGAPGAFTKIAPANLAVDRPLTNLSLGWAASHTATSYDYCYDATNNATCDSGVWTATGTTTSALLPTLTASTTYYWQVRAHNALGTTAADAATWYRFTTGTGAAAPRAPGDFDGDGRTDYTVFRPTGGIWYSHRSAGGPADVQYWGLSADIDVPGDFDGDGKADVAVWRPASGTWYIRQSLSGTMLAATWGSNGDVPFAGDIDADGKSDRIVWRPSTGIWYAFLSNGGTKILHFGMNGDVPIVGDWDGDDRTDFGVWRPGTGTWYVAFAVGGFTSYPWGSGALGDLPVTGDWNGDGRDDFGVWRPGTGAWYIAYSSGGWTGISFGSTGDLPLMGDWDGDGRTDVAVWRESNGVWYVLRSSGGIGYTGWGLAGDRPIGRRPGR